MGDGDDGGGTFLLHLFDFQLDDLFRGVVQGRGGLVQDQDSGFAQEDAGQGDALALAPGQVGAALGEEELIAAGQIFDVCLN